MIGQTISHYRVIQELGRGAMGVVYLAEHTVLGRRVAIKTVSSNYGRFLREARAASALSHPHIATIHDYGKTESGQPYIVMEYIEGKTLEDLIKQCSLTIPKSLRIVREVAEALTEAHRHNIIHRDIKPSNIAVDDRGIVKVLDFGLAKQIGLEQGEPEDESTSLNTQTREGVLVGTPMYFSPEQAMGLELDARSDLFSLGLVLYECLTGKPAFTGVTPMDICAKVIRDNPVPPSQLNAAVSVDLERVTLRALEKSKENRYQSATELAADLQTLELTYSGVGRLSIDQTQLIPKQTTAGGDRRFKIKRLALLALAVLIVSIVSAWLITSRQRPVPPPPPEPAQERLGITANVVEAALSPDGKTVAYVTDEKGGQSIWLRQITTGTDLPVVTAAKVKLKGLSFFPNGDYLSYLKTEGDSADLYQVSTFGGPSRRLAAKVDTPVSFSPDGMQFTFVRYSGAEHLTALMIANADGSNERSLTTLKEPKFFSRGGFYSSGPAWSPDGKLIAVPAYSVTEETYREIIMVNVADGSMNPVNQGRWNIIEKIVWLADGSGFLMNAAESNSSLLQIWQVNRQGGDARRVTRDPSHYVGLSATKNSQAVLTIKNERISAVWIYAPAGDSLVQIASSRYLGANGIAWTPDSRLAVASNINGNYDILTMDADGGNRNPVTFNNRANQEPVVSPDGRYLVYVSFEGRHPHLWRSDIDGGNAQQLTRGGDEDLPRFTLDGKWIVYHHIDQSHYSIRKVSIDGGEPTTVVNPEATQPDVSPTADSVACFARRGGTASWEILVVPIGGGEPVATFALPPTVDPEWPGLRWTPDGLGLTYVVTEQGVSNVWRQAMSGGDPKPLTDFKENRIYFFDWSKSNERKLVLVRGNDTRDLILVRDFLNAN